MCQPWHTRLLSLPGVPWSCRFTFLGGCHYAKMLIQQQQLESALMHYLQLLELKKFQVLSQRWKWWHIMQQGVELIQAPELAYCASFVGYIARLLDLGETTPLPEPSYAAALSLVNLGLWAFQLGKINQARSYLQKAAKVDTHWGYPEYLLGWLGLLDQRVTTNSVAHFNKALTYNWEFLQRLTQDPLCLRFPQVIREVRHNLLLLNKTEK